MISGIAPIALVGKGNLPELSAFTPGNETVPAVSAIPLTTARTPASFLRVPPFPGAKTRSLAPLNACGVQVGDLCARVRRLRVGGTYWAAQPHIPSDCVIVRSAVEAETLGKIARGRPVVLWSVDSMVTGSAPDAAVIVGDCDPWHMLARAAAVVVEPDDELRLIAALSGIPAYISDSTTGQSIQDEADPAMMAAEAIGHWFENPFTGQPMTSAEAIELCGFWRKLVDSNRDIAGGIGFAFWKQKHIAPLLWGGSGAFPFLRNAGEVERGKPVAIWRAKAPPRAVSELDRQQNPLIEVEDGFLRSRGLGADCIPPLSITVDRLGPHFDPSQPSELEQLLQDGGFDEGVLARAADLRRLIVDAGIGKYEQGEAILDRPAGERRHILVPGQVEDDRAVSLGGCGLTSNLELLKRVRADAPDAYVLYKPHPDVLAGHRRGAIVDRVCLEFADQVVGEVPISSLIAMVDEVHVNTSLAGFEALLREKPVTVYGVPFYAGWGLTRDLGPVPARRTALRTLDELVAATLLTYPRYLDPVTGLPCPAEVVVQRLSSREEGEPGLLVGVRRLQGAFMRRLRSLGL